MNIEKIAVIGAGWSGMQIARFLIESGYTVTIFEELDEVGGTWHPALTYYGLTVHSPIYSCSFEGFDDWKNRNLFKKVPAIDVFTYCKEYCDANNLRKYIKFNHRISKANYITEKSKCIISCEDLISKTHYDAEFDFVISTQFNSPRIPKFPGQERFTGKIYHSIEIKEDIFNDMIANKKNIVVLGGNKSATDMAYNFAKRNYNVKWLMEKMYWFISYDKVFYNFKKGKDSKFWGIFMLLAALFNRNKAALNCVFFGGWLLGLLVNPGKLHFDFKKFHFGILDSDQLRTVSKETEQVYGRIAELQENSIKLDNNKILDCDVLICCTGSDIFFRQIKLYINDKPVEFNSMTQLYKYSIFPEIPIVCFTGFSLFGGGPANGYHRSAWILKYLDYLNSLPSLKGLVLSENKTPGHVNTRGNPLFDDSQYYITSLLQIERELIPEFRTNAEVLIFYYYFFCGHKLKVYDKAKEYMQSKKVFSLSDRF